MSAGAADAEAQITLTISAMLCTRPHDKPRNFYY